MRTYVAISLLLIESIAGFGCPAPASQTANTTTTRVTVTPPVDAMPVVTAKGLEPPQPALRLPKNFVPSRYEATLHIDPAKPTFDGVISIVGDVSELSSVIWLHGRGLTVQRAVATQGDPYESPDGTSSALTITPRADDLLEVRAEPALAPGTWTLTIEYTGKIDDTNTAGAFRETVEASTYVFSQFEAVYARRVFPCVDEPDSKVPWKLTLDIPPGVTAVSNTPVERTTTLGDGGKRMAFAVTKPLPSYLIAFGIGPFDILDAGTTKTGTPVRIYTLKGRAPDAAWAAKSTPRILELLEDWFGTPYPYEKLDLITVPLTVGFGAMENAGAVTFSEDSMLFDQQHPSPTKRHRWVSYAAHELAHQWFGDYVTMAWWDDIWLNEGFANWMENKIAARFDPTWHDELSELDMRNSALGADSIVSARQIRQPIQTADDILNAFDGITYDKGASVLNMFESYLGQEVFQRGVRGYLQARAHGNATSTDFVASLSKASGKELAPAFATFLDQAGEPELEAQVQCGAKSPTISFTQRRYVPPGSPEPKPTTPWVLPVCVAYERGGKRAEQCMLVDGATSVALETKKCPRWVMPNVNGRGYFRSHFTPSQVIALRDEAWPALTWNERRAVYFDVADAAKLGRRGPSTNTASLPVTQLSLTLALSLVPKMLAGGDRFTVADALGLPVGLDRMIPDELRPKYESWLRATYTPGASTLGLIPKPTDDLDAESNRSGLVRAAAWAGRDPEMVKQAVELSHNWRELLPSIRGTILAIAVDANPDLFDKIKHDLKSEPDRLRREDMLTALAGVRDPKRVTSALELLLDPALDLRETMYMLILTSTEPTRLAAETFVRDHLEALLKRMPHDAVVGGIASLSYLFTAACDPARRDQLADYVTRTFGTLPGGGRMVAQSIESMDQCIASRTVLEPQVRAWLGGVKIPKPAKPPDKPKQP